MKQCWVYFILTLLHCVWLEVFLGILGWQNQMEWKKWKLAHAWKWWNTPDSPLLDYILTLLGTWNSWIWLYLKVLAANMRTFWIIPITCKEPFDIVLLKCDSSWSVWLWHMTGHSCTQEKLKSCLPCKRIWIYFVSQHYLYLWGSCVNYNSQQFNPTVSSRKTFKKNTENQKRKKKKKHWWPLSPVNS